MDTIIETALLQAEAKRKVAFQSAGLKIKNKKIKIKITEIKRELFLGTVERASFSPTDQFRLFDSCSSLNVERKGMLYQKKKITLKRNKDVHLIPSVSRNVSLIK